MKTITLKSLSIRNFKGIKELDIDFDQLETNISGENGTGKTTVFDALTWMLFGKDSMDNAKFSIKPLDKNNVPLQKVDNEVSGVLIEDGSEITLKRIHRENWVKRRGATETEFVGNETLHYYNDVPQNSGQFKAKVDAMLNEGIFKLVTSPKYFNSLHWEKRREVLSIMAGEVSDMEICKDISAPINQEPLQSLMDALNADKTIDDYRKEIASKKKLIKDDLETIPTRIDEIERNLPEAINTTATEKKIKELQGEIDKLDEEIANAGKGMEAQDAALLKLRDELRVKQNREREIENQTQQTLNFGVQESQSKRIELQGKIKNLQTDIRIIAGDITSTEEMMQENQVYTDKLREEYRSIKAETLTFNDEDFCCPTCKREYETEDNNTEKAKMIEQFNTDKVTRITTNIEKGKAATKNVTDAQDQIKLYNEKVQKLEGSIPDLEAQVNKIPETKGPIIDINTQLGKDTEYTKLKVEIKALMEKINAPREAADISTQQEKKREINAEIDTRKDSISSQDVRKKSTVRMEELKTDEKKLAQELAQYENIEYIILEYTKARTAIIEERVNGKFKYVTFKMFEQQINGGEVPCCTTLINGVPFADANTAGQINAGMDIINALSGHYGVTAPVFVDHKESVNELLDSESQVINLIVTKDQSLTIK